MATEGTCQRGRPRKIWWDCVGVDTESFGQSVMMRRITISETYNVELHLASRITDRRCRPLWAWNDDHVTERRWLDGHKLTVGRQTLNECRAGRTGC